MKQSKKIGVVAILFFSVHLEAMEVSFEKEYNVEVTKELHNRIWTGKITAELVQELIKENADPNAISDDQWEAPPLVRACQRIDDPKLPSIIEALVKGGAHIDMADKGGRTSLHHAATQGKAFAARSLLVLGANKNSIDKNGDTPKICAQDSDRKDVINVLNEYKQKQKRSFLKCCGLEVEED